MQSTCCSSHAPNRRAATTRQRPSQLRATAVQTGHHRADRYVENFGNFLVAHALDGNEQQDLVLFGWELFHGRQDVVGVASDLRCPRRSRSSIPFIPGCVPCSAPDASVEKGPACRSRGAMRPWKSAEDGPAQGRRGSNAPSGAELPHPGSYNRNCTETQR